MLYGACCSSHPPYLFADLRETRGNFFSECETPLLPFRTGSAERSAFLYGSHVLFEKTVVAKDDLKTIITSCINRRFTQEAKYLFHP